MLHPKTPGHRNIPDGLLSINMYELVRNVNEMSSAALYFLQAVSKRMKIFGYFRSDGASQTNTEIGSRERLSVQTNLTSDRQ